MSRKRLSADQCVARVANGFGPRCLRRATTGVTCRQHVPRYAKTADARDREIVAKAGPWIVHEFPDEEYAVIPNMVVAAGESESLYTERWLAACEALARIANRIVKEGTK